MAWVKLDDGFAEHPKIIQVGTAGAWLLIQALCYCNRNLTDGFIPARIARAMAGGRVLITRMLVARLWEACENGYKIHDFSQYQPTRSEVITERERWAERQRKYRMSRRDSQRESPVSHAVPVPVPVKKKKISERHSRLPATETLTPERMQMARSLGLTTAGATMQWAAMADYEFFRPRTDWDA